MANANLFSQIGLLERLKGRENFDVWQISARAALELTDLWQYVEEKVIEKDAAKIAEGQRKAKAKLTLMIDPVNYSHIHGADTAAEMWKRLVAAFDDGGLMRRVGLLRTIINTKLDNCSSMEQFVHSIITTAHKLTCAGLKVDDEWIATLLLAGLGDDYKPMIMAIESSGTKISSDFVKTKLLQHVSAEAATNESNALFARKSGNKSCGQGKDHGKGIGSSGGDENQPKEDSQKSGFNHSKWLKSVQCYECNQIGHIARKCPKKETKQEVSSLFCLTASRTGSGNDWFLDSGASHHMCNERERFTNVRPTAKKEVTMANNSQLPVIGAGQVRLKLDRGADLAVMTAELNDVLFVPDLCTNLMSVSQLRNKGCSVKFSAGGCEIHRSDGILVGRARLVNGMYKLVECETATAFTVFSKSKKSARKHRKWRHKEFKCADVPEKNQKTEVNNCQFYLFTDDDKIEVEELEKVASSDDDDGHAKDDDDPDAQATASGNDEQATASGSDEQAAASGGDANNSFAKAMVRRTASMGARFVQAVVATVTQTSDYDEHAIHHDNGNDDNNVSANSDVIVIGDDSNANDELSSSSEEEDYDDYDDPNDESYRPNASEVNESEDLNRRPTTRSTSAKNDM